MIFNHRHNTGQFWSLLKWLEEPSDPDVAVENLKQFDAGLRNWFYDSLGGRYLIDSEYRKNTYTGLQARTRELLRRRPIAQPLGSETTLQQIMIRITILTTTPTAQ